MASPGQDEDLVDQRLDSDLHSLNAVVLKEGEDLFAQGVRPCGDADGIDLTGGQKRLYFSQIGDQVFPADRRKTSPVEGNLDLSGSAMNRELVK